MNQRPRIRRAELALSCIQVIMKALLALLCTFISIAAAADVANVNVAPSDDAIQTDKFSDSDNPTSSSSSAINEKQRHDATSRNSRKLWCQGSSPTKLLWHPVYSAGWTNGYCRYNIDCDAPGYASELQCCKFAYAGQISGHCISRLPSPPTKSPTNVGELIPFIFVFGWDTYYAICYFINHLLFNILFSNWLVNIRRAWCLLSRIFESLG